MRHLRTGLFLGVFLIVLGLVLVLGTAPGFRFLLAVADSVAPVTIQAERTAGSLAHGVRIHGLDVGHDAFSLTIGDMDFDAAILPLLYGRLELAHLHFTDINVSLRESEQQDAAGDIPALPVAVDIYDLRINGFMASNDRGRLFEFKTLSASLQAGPSEIGFKDLSLYSNRYAVHGGGTIRYRPDPGIDADLSWTLEEEGARPVVAGRTRIRGGGSELNLNTGITQPIDGRLDVIVDDVMTDLNWRAKLETRAFNPRGLLDNAPDLRAAVTLDARGTLTGLSMKGDLILTDIGIPAARIQDEDGDNRMKLGLRIDAAREGDAYRAGADIGWDPFSLAVPHQDGSLAFPAGKMDLILEPADLQVRVDTGFSLDDRQGRMRISVTADRDRIRLETVDITAGGMTWQTQGEINNVFDTPVADLQSRWQNLSIPLAEDHILQLPRGELGLQGRLDDYRLNVNGQLRSPKIPDTEVRLTATGNSDGLRIRPLTLATLDGTATANGSAQWSEAPRIDLDWQGRRLDPGTLWPDWPGRLDLNGRTIAERPAQDWQFEIRGLNVRGTLREQPLSLDLDSGIRGNSVRLQQARLASGEATLRASGEVSPERADLEWHLNVPDLDGFLPESGGSVRGSGEYTGTPAQPVISGTLEAAAIKSPWLNVDRLSADLDIDLKDTGRVVVRTDVSELAYGEVRIGDLQLRVNGSGAAHDYRLTVENDKTRLNLAGQGGYREQRWQGRTRNLTLTHDKLGTWELRQAAVTTIGKEQSGLDEHCLGRDKAVICLQGNRRGGDNWQASLNTSNTPVSLGRPWFPFYLDAAGQFDLDLSLSVRNGTASGRGTWTLSPGHVDFRIDEDEVQRFNVTGGSAELALDNGRLTGGLDLNFADLSDPIHARLELDGLQRPWPPDPAGVRLRGGISGSVDDLGFIASVTPHVTDTSGTLAVDMEADGTLSRPEVTGEFHLREAGFHAPDLGVAAKKMNIRGTTTEAGDYRLEGQWQSGGGVTRIRANLAESPGGMVMRAEVTGEDAEIINLPEIQARASPDLRLEFSPGKRSVSGEIRVTSATIDLDEVTTTTPVSGDVVIVDRETGQKKTTRLRTDLTVFLGEEIRIKGEGITGKLGGQLRISNNDKGETIATGEVRIRDGAYSAYGQSLTIEEGRLIYQQSRLDNPEVRIRAVRQVEDISAGIRVSGYLTNPQVTLFSTPAMNQEQILSYIVFGRPLDGISSGEGADLIGAATSLGLQNSGFITSSLANTFGLDEIKVKTEPGAGTENASLIIGKYLTPKLYLSYGMGLFETMSTATIRYDISKRWAVEAQQGEEVGADLLFKLEK